MDLAMEVETNFAAALADALSGVSFDQAVFFEHARDDEQGLNQNLSCPRLVIDADGHEIEWLQRWQPELSVTAKWFRGNSPWVEDLEKIADDLVGAGDTRVRDLATVKRFRADGIRAVLGIAIFAQDRIDASLLIGSRNPGAYGAVDRTALRRNKRVRFLLNSLVDLLRARRQNLILTLRDRFQPGRPPEQLASEFVTIVAEENRWDFVGIYRVESEFAMVASCDRTKNQVLKIDPDYRQALDVGMLGQTLLQQKCLRADDVNVEPPPFNYSKVIGFDARSALCYPIFVSGKIQWILDCGSTASAAFRGPDRKMLDEIVGGLQSTLNLWFETRLSSAILDGLADAVLVVDRAGFVVRANAAAVALFDIRDETQQQLIALAADDESRAKFDPIRSLKNDAVRLRASTGTRELLATSRLSSQAFGQFVVTLSPKGEHEWAAGLTLAKKTVEAELGQGRVLLMLAGALLGRVRRQVAAARLVDDASGIDATLERVAEAIDRADLSYDQIAGAMAGKQSPRLDSLVANVLIDIANHSSPATSRLLTGRDDAVSTKAVFKAVASAARQLIESASAVSDSKGTSPRTATDASR